MLLTDTRGGDLLTYRLVSRRLKLPEHAVFISDIWIRTKTDSGSLNTMKGWCNGQRWKSNLKDTWSRGWWLCRLIHRQLLEDSVLIRGCGRGRTRNWSQHGGRTARTKLLESESRKSDPLLMKLWRILPVHKKFWKQQRTWVLRTLRAHINANSMEYRFFQGSFCTRHLAVSESYQLKLVKRCAFLI